MTHEVIAFIIITIVLLALIFLLFIVDRINNRGLFQVQTTPITPLAPTQSEIRAALIFGAIAALLGIILWIYLIYLFFAGHNDEHHDHIRKVTHSDNYYGGNSMNSGGVTLV